MASALFNPYSNNGFYKAPVTKALLGTLITSHVALQVPMFAGISKFLICLIPDSLVKGDYWRLLTSKLMFLDTKDAILCLILLYQFRIFERRYGSRKFASFLVGTSILTTIFELLLSTSILAWYQSNYGPDGDILNFKGRLLAVGPFGLILPLFVPFYTEVPQTSGATFGGLSVSAKSMNYILGLQVIASSSSNVIVGLSAIAAGIFYRKNLLWTQTWTYIPKTCASICDKIFGWAICSERSPEAEKVILGATLEIQRLQREEILEQQILRQQARLQHRNNPFRRGGAIRPFLGQRRQGGENFIDRLIRDNNRQNVEGDAALPANILPQRNPHQQGQDHLTGPSEENINILMEMGFTRERVTQALRETNNDLELATVILLQQ